MYAAQGLNGTESTSFWQYWEIVRTRLGDILDLGPRIKEQWERAKSLRAKASASEQAELDEKIYQWSRMYVTWEQAQEYINEWRDRWQKIEESVRELVPEGFLSVLPIILPAWALATLAAGGLAALTFVATQGLSLIKQYQFEKSVLDQIERRIVSPEQAAKIIESGKPAGTTIFGTGGAAAVLGIIAAVGLWFAMKDRNVL